jgi:predicted RNA-binding protein YlxR (DUF448 family)
MPAKRVKRQPQRTCIGCRRILTKRELNRVVRTVDGRIVIDPTGKVPGRGAYVCDNRQCWLDSLARKRFERALKVELSDGDRAMIEEYAALHTTASSATASNMTPDEPDTATEEQY